MSKIKAVELDGEIIYMQVDDELSVDDSDVPTASDDGFERKGDSSPALPVVNNLKGLIKTMAKTTLNSISEATSAEVDKINLEFAVKLSSEAGFFIASGKAEGSVKVSVDLRFPERKPDERG
ncbi:MAG: hypothetical protein GY862_28595 [Gammaproteobacteria bacterium]|nr:hypothetical protein [Gammaproteobacteria bacterium]